MNVLNELEEIKIIFDVVNRYYSQDSKISSNGAIFIAPLEGGSLRFLHSVFPPANDENLKETEDLIGPLPAQYKSLLKHANGATLYDSTVFIYGTSSFPVRSLRIDDQAAVSVIAERSLRLASTGSSIKNLRVGAVATATRRFDIDIELDSTCLVSYEGGSRRFESFLECLSSIVIIMDSLSDANGLLDDSGEQAESEMIAFIRRDA